MANEKRLIDANSLINNYDLHIVIGAGDNICIDIADIAKAPTVEAVEVVHGRWIRRKSSYSQTGFVDQCSVCQFALVHLGQKTNYCPNCGAIMDGRSNVPRMDGDGNA